MSFTDRDFSESSENEDILFFENFAQDMSATIKKEETDLRSELVHSDSNGFFDQDYSREELRIMLAVFF